MGGILVILVVALVYFVPIFVLNLLLGWTSIGWVLANVWTSTVNRPELPV